MLKAAGYQSSEELQLSARHKMCQKVGGTKTRNRTNLFILIEHTERQNPNETLVLGVSKQGLLEITRGLIVMTFKK